MFKYQGVKIFTWWLLHHLKSHPVCTCSPGWTFSPGMGIFTLCGHSHLVWTFSPCMAEKSSYMDIFISHGLKMLPHMDILTECGAFSSCLNILTLCGYFHLMWLKSHIVWTFSSYMGYFHLAWIFSPWVTSCEYSHITWTCSPHVGIFTLCGHKITF